MFVMKLSSLPLNFSLASSEAFGAKKGWIEIAAEDEQMLMHLDTLWDLYFTFGNLRAEFSNSITLSHLQVVLACDTHFPCNKPGDGI